jgi:hypothetical protein
MQFQRLFYNRLRRRHLHKDHHHRRHRQQLQGTQVEHHCRQDYASYEKPLLNQH